MAAVGFRPGTEYIINRVAGFRRVDSPSRVKHLLEEHCR
jgi:hypothetical protein